MMAGDWPPRLITTEVAERQGFPYANPRAAAVPNVARES